MTTGRPCARRCAATTPRRSKSNWPRRAMPATSFPMKCRPISWRLPANWGRPRGSLPRCAENCARYSGNMRRGCRGRRSDEFFGDVGDGLVLAEIVAVPDRIRGFEVARVPGKFELELGVPQVRHRSGVHDEIILARENDVGGEIAHPVLPEIFPELPPRIFSLKVRFDHIVHWIDGAGPEPKTVDLVIVADGRLPRKSRNQRYQRVHQRRLGECAGD